ncbi:transposable element Tcb2 transposase [Trichonephila clavipes]|nr:transposable element Tcb2 transposase [Trichonephila clavipes]
MPLRRFRRQYEQLSQSERGRIIGMIEAGWSVRQVARQLGRSDCIVRRCWDQGIREGHLHEDQGQDVLNRPVVEKTTTSRRLEGHLGSWRPLRVLPLTPPIDPTVWRDAAHEKIGLQRNGTRSSLATNPDSDDNCVRVWRPRGECLNPAFASQRHIAPTAGVMIWSAIAYNTWSPLVLIRGTMTALRYVHDILQPHVLPLMQRLPRAIFQQANARPLTTMTQVCLRTVTTLSWPVQPADLSAIEHIWDHLGR